MKVQNRPRKLKSSKCAVSMLDFCRGKTLLGTLVTNDLQKCCFWIILVKYFIKLLEFFPLESFGEASLPSFNLHIYI